MNRFTTVIMVFLGVELAFACLATAQTGASSVATLQQSAVEGGSEGFTAVSLEGQAGLAVPLGNLSNAASLGGSFGVGASFWLSPKVALRASVEFEPLSGADFPQLEFDSFSSQSAASESFPGTTIWYYSAGVELAFLNASESPWSLNATIAAGGATVGVEYWLDETTESNTYFAGNTGLSVGHRIGSRLDGFLRQQAHVIFNNSDDYAGGGDNNLQPSSPLWTLETTLGIRFFVSGPPSISEARMD